MHCTAARDFFSIEVARNTLHPNSGKWRCTVRSLLCTVRVTHCVLISEMTHTLINDVIVGEASGSSPPEVPKNLKINWNDRLGKNNLWVIFSVDSTVSNPQCSRFSSENAYDAVHIALGKNTCMKGQFSISISQKISSLIRISTEMQF